MTRSRNTILRRVLGSLVLIIVLTEVVLVLTGVLDFASAAKFTVAMELCLAGFVFFEAWIIVKAVRSARTSGADLPFALDDALAEFFPAAVARYVRQDLMLVRAIWMLLAWRRDVRDGEHPIAYSGPLVVLLSCIAVLDGLAAFVLHLLLPDGIRTVALVLGILGLVWLLGFVASLVCYPHVVGEDRIRLRFSAFHDVIVPLSALDSAHAVDGTPESTSSAARVDDQLVMAVAGQANLAVTTQPDAALTTLHPRLRGNMPSRVRFYADDRREALDLIRRAIA